MRSCDRSWPRVRKARRIAPSRRENVAEACTNTELPGEPAEAEPLLPRNKAISPVLPPAGDSGIAWPTRSFRPGAEIDFNGAVSALPSVMAWVLPPGAASVILTVAVAPGAVVTGANVGLPVALNEVGVILAKSAAEGLPTSHVEDLPDAKPAVALRVKAAGSDCATAPSASNVPWNATLVPAVTLGMARTSCPSSRRSASSEVADASDALKSLALPFIIRIPEQPAIRSQFFKHHASAISGRRRA